MLGPNSCLLFVMSSITDIRSVLTQKALNFFCETFHIPDEVHPQLPSPNQTIHEMPTGKIEIDLLSFIRTADPTNVRIGERQRGEDKPKLLDTTVGHHRWTCDSASGGGGHDVNIMPATEITDTVAETVIPLQPRRLKKRKNIAADAGGPSHPPKKLREDHETPSGVSVGGMSRSAVQRFLVGAVQNAEVRGGVIPTLPFVTSYVSATPKHEDRDHTDSVVGANLWTIIPVQRFVISLDFSHHSDANIAEVEVDSFAKPSIPLMTVTTTVTSTIDPATTVKEKFVRSSVFGGGSSSAGGADHTVDGFSNLTGSDFIVGGIRTVISPDTDLQKVYVPQWSVTNGSRLDDGRACREIVDGFAPPKFFASIRRMDHDQLFMEFNVGAARQISLSVEVRMHVEYNIRERMRLNYVAEEKNSLLKTKDEEIEIVLRGGLLFLLLLFTAVDKVGTDPDNMEKVKASLPKSRRVA
ncbi:hypothetical protein Tco_0773871 [Tanacetum coccineum]|uniref:Uncharacterized protein n=1 Tax=Tanacetum coccineum TaxID=301880 RepID=A0ABQ4ZMU6_9ASTR